MTDYPNREHQVADEAARRRAGKCLDTIEDEIKRLRHRLLLKTPELYGNDARTIAYQALDLGVHLSALETLRDVREWDAADKADEAASKGRVFVQTVPQPEVRRRNG